MARIAKVKRPGSSGLGNVQKRSKEIDAKRAGSRAPYLASQLASGDSAVLRVLDIGKDFKDGYVHSVEMTYEDDDGKTKEYNANVMCLDQDEEGEPCPGCADGLDRFYKFWTNVIVRDWEDEDSGKSQDTLMIWSGGIKLAKRLDKLNSRHSLLNRDLLLEREGVKLNTTWDVDWAADEDSDLTDSDIELAKNKTDLSQFVKVRDADDFFKTNKEIGDAEADTGDVGEKSVRRGSAFGGKKKSGVSSRRTPGKKTGLAAMKARADDKATAGKPKVKAKTTKPAVKIKRR